MDDELLQENIDDLLKINNRIYYWVEHDNIFYLRNLIEIEFGEFDPLNYGWIVRLRTGCSENWTSSDIIADLNIAYAVQDLFPINILPSENYIHPLMITNFVNIIDAMKQIENQITYSFSKLVKSVKFMKTRKMKILHLLNLKK